MLKDQEDFPSIKTHDNAEEIFSTASLSHELDEKEKSLLNFPVVDSRIQRTGARESKRIVRKIRNLIIFPLRQSLI